MQGMTSAASEQCIRNIAKLFQESYPGRGGKIARGELLRFLALVTRGAIADASLQQVVDVADKDGSGTLDIVDFLSWLFSQAKVGGQEGNGAWPLRRMCASLGTPPVGVGMIYLATPRTEVPHIDQLPETSKPFYGDSIDRFREHHAGDEALLVRLRNKVKVCTSCNKACAYTLSSCNSCGASLGAVGLSCTDNVFMGFVYGIARGRFPYTISMRAQSPEILCFDDPLAVSVCHLNAIPTAVYVPDLRFLFRDPPRGLALVNQLFQVASAAALDQFWGSEAFRRKLFAGQPKPESPEAIIDIALCGMNFPPSMFQLHLQFIHPPLLPFHYCLALDDGHFHHGRFFPLEYIRAALALGDAVKMDVNDDTDIADIIRTISAQGISYDSCHSALMRKCRRVQQLFSAWEEADFEHQVVNGKAFSLLGGLAPAPNKDAKGLQKEDAKALQNYGRPYDAEGQPTGTYYRYAKDPAEVANFAAAG